MKTFVDIVGYQLEKVHTGVIKYLLDWENDEISFEDKRKIINDFYVRSNKPIRFDVNEISNIYCTPEYPFGRKLKIDLVIEIELRSGDKHHLVTEMKVDSLPYEDQLSRIFSSFSSGVDNNSNYFLFLIGSSSVCQLPEPNKLHGFSVVKIDEIISIFSDLNTKSKIYNDWIQTLNNEIQRRDSLINTLDQIESESFWKINNRIWLSKGYRIPFPLFYYLYHHLRKQLRDENGWEIYSVANNPVMNWSKEWVGKQGDILRFFWEFNYSDFCLKICYDTRVIDYNMLNEIRNRVYEFCEKTKNIQGRKTTMRYANQGYASIFKWNFDFKRDTFSFIADAVENDILSIQPELRILQSELCSITPKT